MNTDYIAVFEKVSFEQFLKDMMSAENVTDEHKPFTDDQTNIPYPSYKEYVFEIWKSIPIPQRMTFGAAGYDFYIPKATNISSDAKLFPTGIRAKINDGWVLMLFPRSGYGTKYGMALSNTTGIIDSDYYFANNEGHIMAKIKSDIPFDIKQGERFMQGVFLPFGLSMNGNNGVKRVGGLGSTGAN